jgi:acetyl esterase
MNLLFREKAGVKIISIDYPKAPEHPYPAAVEAVYEVALYYVANAAAYGIDPARVGIGGHSAGANLATVTCMWVKERGDLNFRFQLLDYPPLDIYTEPLEKRVPKKDMTVRMAPLFNACYASREEAKDPHVSPIFASIQQLAGLPPALIIVAGMDSLHDEGVRYADMLRQAGVEVELHDFENAIHGFTLKESKDSMKARLLMADFIARHS